MTYGETLKKLGWRPFFAGQLDDTDAALLEPARVLAVHRSRLELAGIAAPDVVSGDPNVAVGDWVLVDPKTRKVARVLDRFSLFKRRGAGTQSVTQLIAANVDSLFIVTSANREFNVARLERYLALAHNAGSYPIVVITKADTVPSAIEYVDAAAKLSPGLLVEAMDARDPEAVSVLRPWCGPGQTVALLGSSGVGKSTLINTLTGAGLQTREVREDDQRGRHTTTARSMHALPSGGWLIDTPGMRELRIVDAGDSLDDLFAEIAALAHDCRFADCDHDTEPGCEVRAAIARGGLDEARLERYRKLKREDRHNTESVAERRSRDKAFGKLYKAVKADLRRRKG